MGIRAGSHLGWAVGLGPQCFAGQHLQCVLGPEGPWSCSEARTLCQGSLGKLCSEGTTDGPGVGWSVCRWGNLISVSNIMQTCSGWERTVYGKPVWEHYLAKSNCSYCTLVSVILYNTFYSLSHVPLACSSWVHSWSETVAGSCTQSFWSICKDFQFSLTLGGLNCSLRPLIILAEQWAVQLVKQLILQYFDRCILTAKPHK